MQVELDDIDKGMLKSIAEHPGQNAATIFKPFLRQKSETVLRQRLRKLEIFDFVRTERGVNSLNYFPKKREMQ